MNEILSQDEVNALLKTIDSPAETGKQSESAAGSPEFPSGQGAEPSAPKGVSTGVQYGINKKVTVYNFRHPDRVPKPLLRSLQLLHDKFCPNVSSSLSAYLRTVTEVSVLSVEQTTYMEFLLSLSDPTYYSAISIKPLSGMAALEMNLDLVFPIIDLLLGGTGSVLKLSRNITEIEKNIIQGVIKLITANLTETWRPVSLIDFAFRASETRPQLLQVAAANEVVILIIFEVKIGETRSSLHLCIPFSSLEPIAGKFEQEISVRSRRHVREEFQKVLKTLYKTPLTLSAELAGGEVSVRDLLTLLPGDVVRLDQAPTEQVVVHVGGKPRFVSAAVVLKDHKAVKILTGTDSNI